MTAPKDRILVALDTPDVDRAATLAAATADAAGGVKIGLEFFNVNGHAGVKTVVGPGVPLFLDLKFHDIPNTVAGAVRSVAPLAPLIVNVHAGGGPEMLRAGKTASVEAAAALGVAPPKVIAVTVLTSLDTEDLAAVGQDPDARAQAVRLARLARDCGLDGVVCSSLEIAPIRDACGPDFTLVVPGIRPAGADSGDQKRVMTPAEAISAGADYLVIGRPITGADDPAAAARAIAESL